MDLSQLLRALGLQQAYQSYQENIGQPFANVAGPFGRGLLGLERPEYGQEQAYRTGQAVGNMPAVSAPVGAMKAAMQAPGLLADATQAMKGLDLAGLLGLTAYHGSPYRFSRFDPTKIGSGEGSQAYGYGMYFAENPAVAGSYKEMAHALPISPAAQQAFAVLNSNVHPSMQARALANLPKEAIEEAKSYKGNLYTVDIPDEMIGRMLDYDKPLNKQSAEIQSKLKSIVDVEIGKGTWDNWIKTNPDFRNLTNDLFERKTDAEISSLIQRAGIPGVRYLDSGSRVAWQGTRNFVVFPGEEEAIKMLSVE